jgi:bla regulator protein blaR1
MGSYRVFISGSSRFSFSQIFAATFHIINLIQSHEHRIMGKYKFIETKQDHGPFSFFKYIVYNPELHNPAERELIFKHEQVHSSQYHTMDILISNIVCCILWFNPLSWLYKKSIVQNLEFIADKETVAATESKKQYLKTLIKVSLRDLHPALTNSFYQSFIKKRIVMLNKTSHPVNNLWKLNLVFPAVLAFMLTFNVQTEFYAQEVSSTVASNTEVKIEIDKNTTQDKLDGFIKLMDEYNVILKFEDIQYNNEGLLTNINVEFIDRSNVSSGTITKTNPSGIEGFRYIYNQKEGSRFSTPTTPSFREESVIVKRSGAKANDTIKGAQTFVTVTSQKEPIYVVNGKIIANGAGIDTLNPANVKGISVLKGYAAKALYGEDAKDGAISITTRATGDSTRYRFHGQNVIFRDSVRFDNKVINAFQRLMLG